MGADGTLFDLGDGARVFGIEPGTDFAESLVDGLLQRLAGAPPDALARVTIFTNNRRSERRLEEVFNARSVGFLPVIRVVTDPANDPTLPLALGPEESGFSRQLSLFRLVRQLLTARPELAPASSAFGLAGSLLSLLDELQGAGLRPDALETLDGLDVPQHWQTSAAFLALLKDLWPERDEERAMGTEARQRAAIDALEQKWAAKPPGPVLVAGSTGSRPNTARLMAAVLKLPQGGVVLPGYDRYLNRRSVSALKSPRRPEERDTAEHPQAVLVRLLETLGLDHGEVQVWGRPSGDAARARLISLALRPAPVTDDWRHEGRKDVPDPAAATAGLARLTAPNGRMEAAAIATALRDALEAGQRAVLVTPDATLSRRVTAFLARWGLQPDDSAGRPLHLTPPGILAMQTLDILKTDGLLGTAALTALLKHPLVAAGDGRGAHLRTLRSLERKALRQVGPTVSLDTLRNAETGPWLDWLGAALTPLLQAEATLPLGTWLKAHRETLEALVAGPDAAPDPLYEEEAGKAFSKLFSTAEADAETTPVTLSLGEYRDMIRSLLTAEQARLESFIADPRIAIWGQLEARVQTADLVVLAGLNEGTWPRSPAADPWLSRPMRRHLGLTSPDQVVGLSAHDFQTAIANRTVILSRSERTGDSPSVQSRWLTRLENLLKGLGDDGETAWEEMATRGDAWLQQAHALDAPDQTVQPEPRPAPAPPLDARPTETSVTEVEKLVRDPYAVYAHRVLNLRPLDDIGRLPDARDRGTAFHKVFEAFVKATEDGLPEDAEAVFREATERALGATIPWPAERRLWQAKLLRMAGRFLEAEALRRDGVTRHLTEIPGEVEIDLPAPMTLRAKPDRIDCRPDGAVIYDYKSAVPTGEQRKFYDVQLALEGAMLLHGAFSDAGTRLAGLDLLSIAEPSKASPVEVDTIPETLLRLKEVLSHYQAAENGYPAMLFERSGQRGKIPGDYDHLARRGEWDDDSPFETVPVG